MKLHIYKIGYLAAYCKRDDGKVCILDKSLLPRDIKQGDTIILNDDIITIDSTLKEPA